MTDSTLILFGYTQGFSRTRIEDPVARIARDRLLAWSWQKGKIAASLNFAFDDDSTVAIEVPRANSPSSFAEKLKIPQAG